MTLIINNDVAGRRIRLNPATFGELTDDGIWTRADVANQLWLYNDDPASRRDYFARVGRVIALTDGPIKYAQRLMGHDPPPPSPAPVEPKPSSPSGAALAVAVHREGFSATLPPATPSSGSLRAMIRAPSR